MRPKEGFPTCNAKTEGPSGANGVQARMWPATSYSPSTSRFGWFVWRSSQCSSTLWDRSKSTLCLSWLPPSSPFPFQHKTPLQNRGADRPNSCMIWLIGGSALWKLDLPLWQLSRVIPPLCRLHTSSLGGVRTLAGQFTICRSRYLWIHLHEASVLGPSVTSAAGQ